MTHITERLTPKELALLSSLASDQLKKMTNIYVGNLSCSATQDLVRSLLSNAARWNV